MLIRIGCLLALLFVMPLPRVQGTDRETPDPPSAHRFLVSFEGMDALHVVSVRGLSSESIPTLSMEPGGEDRLKVAEIVITRPLTPPDALWSWREAIVAGEKDVRSGQIVLLGPDNTPVYTYVLVNAWPFKWVWPDLDASCRQPAMEEIHFLVAGVFPLGHVPKELFKEKTDKPGELKKKTPFDSMDEAFKRKSPED